ncbi:unnamed protein product [Caenorhabditis sp. 36 PRJEB53466]|nr:unnamed protein product [Caenorhabditis sp. 36 PRJEB53466]
MTRRTLHRGAKTDAEKQRIGASDVAARKENEQLRRKVAALQAMLKNRDELLSDAKEDLKKERQRNMDLTIEKGDLEGRIERMEDRIAEMEEKKTSTTTTRTTKKKKNQEKKGAVLTTRSVLVTVEEIENEYKM